MNKTRDRFTGATIAILLQLGLVTIFIYSLPLMAPTRKRPQEITFYLSRLREAVKPAAAARRNRVSPTPPFAAPPLTAPPIFVPPATTAPPAAGLQTFGNQLFGCAPENLNNLTPEQRAHCSGLAALPQGKGAVGEPPSLVKDPTRREAELAARNTPARVPCVDLRSRSLGFSGGQDTGVVADFVCLLNGWAHGFGGLPP
jgi:hypothetical protein